MVSNHRVEKKDIQPKPFIDNQNTDRGKDTPSFTNQSRKWIQRETPFANTNSKNYKKLLKTNHQIKKKYN